MYALCMLVVKPAQMYCACLLKVHLHHSQAGMPSMVHYLHMLPSVLLPHGLGQQCTSLKGPGQAEKYLMFWKVGVFQGMLFSPGNPVER